MASEAALMAVVEAPHAEQQRRAKLRGQESGNAREILYRRLDQMAANRKRLSDDLPAMTAAQMADLERYFRDLAGRQVG
jgi:hypothetical protein